MAGIKEMMDLAQYSAGPGRLTEKHPGGGGGIIGLLAGIMQGQQVKQEKAQKEQTRKVDMYKTLREAGYDSLRAYDAVMKGAMPDVPGGESIKGENYREKILDKVARDETLTAGEQKVYDEVIKHKQPDDLSGILAGKGKPAAAAAPSAVTPNKQKLNDRIMEKMANGETLTAGEQKIYDEVIKKQQKPESDLAAVLEGKKATPTEEMVNVVSPDGRKGKIPKSKLAAALKAGYKKR